MTTETRIKVPLVFAARNITGYTAIGVALKTEFHREGMRFLRAVADKLGITGACDIRSNLAGVAVSGEITLHGERIYIQLYESATSPGVSVLYRSCKGRKDYSGGMNHWQSAARFAQEPDALDKWLEHARKLMQQG